MPEGVWVIYMEPKKVLVFGMTENPGGVESFLKNYYVHMDRESVQFDFLCNSYNPIAYEEEFQALGGKTIHFPPRHSHPIGFRHKLEQFFKEYAKEYAAIWVNVNSLANIDYLKLAKKYGIEKRIIHSHNSENMDSGLMGKLRGILHRQNKKKLAKWATDFWACSEGAAKFFYDDREAVVIHNAIDLERMSFSETKRKEFRDKLGVSEECIVVGNVGRLHFQKNQAFLLEIFAEYVKLQPTARLVLVGQGEDEAMLREKTDALGLSDSVIFTGVQYDIQGYMCAFDVYAFPSVFEGLGLVGLEAEANGLPVLAAERVIPTEIQLLSNFAFLPLEETKEAWAAKLDAQRQLGRIQDTEQIHQAFLKAGYDIRTEVNKLQERF